MVSILKESPPFFSQKMELTDRRARDKVKLTSLYRLTRLELLKYVDHASGDFSLRRRRKVSTPVSGGNANG